MLRLCRPKRHEHKSRQRLMHDTDRSKFIAHRRIAGKQNRLEAIYPAPASSMFMALVPSIMAFDQGHEAHWIEILVGKRLPLAAHAHQSLATV